MSRNFFPEKPNIKPKIYGYIDPGYEGFIKIDYTARSVSERMSEHYPTLLPTDKLSYTVVLEANACREDGTVFYDKEVHAELEQMGAFCAVDPNGKKTEWFKYEPCKISGSPIGLTPFYNAINSVMKRETATLTSRHLSFDMRPEQKTAVDKTVKLFNERAKKCPNQKPHFFVECKNAFWQNFCYISIRKSYEL